MRQPRLLKHNIPHTNHNVNTKCIRALENFSQSINATLNTPRVSPILGGLGLPGSGFEISLSICLRGYILYKTPRLRARVGGWGCVRARPGACLRVCACVCVCL